MGASPGAVKPFAQATSSQHGINPKPHLPSLEPSRLGLQFVDLLDVVEKIECLRRARRQSIFHSFASLS